MRPNDPRCIWTSDIQESTQIFREGTRLYNLQCSRYYFPIPELRNTVSGQFLEQPPTRTVPASENLARGACAICFVDG